MKNEFKKTYADNKVDADGKKLTEKIGKGTDQKQLVKVLKERGSVKDTTISFKIENKINHDLHHFAIENNMSKSFIIQTLIKNFLKNN
tara:strand:+ start:840 stop:1103 length:264 start_codon:yes stop_codon:yes gene_type:complete